MKGNKTGVSKVLNCWNLLVGAQKSTGWDILWQSYKINPFLLVHEKGRTILLS